MMNGVVERDVYYYYYYYFCRVILDRWRRVDWVSNLWDLGTVRFGYGQELRA